MKFEDAQKVILESPFIERYYTDTQIRESLERLLYVGIQSDKIEGLPEVFEMPFIIRRNTLDMWG